MNHIVVAIEEDTIKRLAGNLLRLKVDHLDPVLGASLMRSTSRPAAVSRAFGSGPERDRGEAPGLAGRSFLSPGGGKPGRWACGRRPLEAEELGSSSVWTAHELPGQFDVIRADGGRLFFS